MKITEYSKLKDLEIIDFFIDKSGDKSSVCAVRGALVENIASVLELNDYTTYLLCQKEQNSLFKFFIFLPPQCPRTNLGS